MPSLTPGDYVVHATHGIGIFEGIHKIDMQGVTKDYIKLRYAKNDTLICAGHTARFGREIHRPA